MYICCVFSYPVLQDVMVILVADMFVCKLVSGILDSRFVWLGFVAEHTSSFLSVVVCLLRSCRCVCCFGEGLKLSLNEDTKLFSEGTLFKWLPGNDMFFVLFFFTFKLDADDWVLKYNKQGILSI